MLIVTASELLLVESKLPWQSKVTYMLECKNMVSYYKEDKNNN